MTEHLPSMNKALASIPSPLKKQKCPCQVWWHVPGLQKLKKEDFKLEVNLGYIARTMECMFERGPVRLYIPQ